MGHDCVLQFKAAATILLLCVVGVAPVEAVPRAGVIDSTGEWVIEPRYANIQWLGNGLYLTYKPELFRSTCYSNCRLMNESGVEVKIPLAPDCTLSGLLTELRPPIKSSKLLFTIRRENNIGVCDINGSIIIPPIYAEIKTFSEGYFTAIEHHTSDTLFITQDGKMTGRVSSKEYEFHSNGFHDGVVLGEYARRCSNGAGKEIRSFKFFTPGGKPLPLPNLCQGESFSEGYAAVGIADTDGELQYSCLIDKDGQIFQNQKFQRVQNFYDGQAIFIEQSTDGERYGVIDRSGARTVPAKFYLLRVNAHRTYIASTKTNELLIDCDGNVKATFHPGLVVYPEDTEPGLMTSFDKSLPSKNNNHRGYVMQSGEVINLSNWPKGILAPAWTKDGDSYLCGLRSAKGWVIQPQFTEMGQRHENRWVARMELKTFNKDDWRVYCDRENEWKKLLANTNIIGKSREEISELLGAADQGTDLLYYTKAINICGNASSGYLLAFIDNKLARWCIAPGFADFNKILAGDNGWFKEDVAFSAKEQTFVPKHHR